MHIGGRGEGPLRDTVPVLKVLVKAGARDDGLVGTDCDAFTMGSIFARLATWRDWRSPFGKTVSSSRWKSSPSPPPPGPDARPGPL
jgi:hypothetical protein